MQVQAVANFALIGRILRAGLVGGCKLVGAIHRIWGTDDLKLRVGAAPDADDGRLEKANGRVQPDGLQVGQIRRGFHG